MNMSENRLQAFLYLLMRDHLPTGEVVNLINSVNDQDKITFTATEIADYANNLAGRLLKGDKK